MPTVRQAANPEGSRQAAAARRLLTERDHRGESSAYSLWNSADGVIAGRPAGGLVGSEGEMLAAPRRVSQHE